MQENNQQNQNNMCGCGMCASGVGMCNCGHGHHHGKFVLLRWILGIIIITSIFSMGVKFGEIKARLEGSYGYQEFGGARMMRFESPVMNQMYTVPAAGATTVQAAPATIIKK